MAVKIRFARFGCKNRPFYRIVVADNQTPRDGKSLEVLGYYNPLPGKDDGKQMALKFDRVNEEHKHSMHKTGYQYLAMGPKANLLLSCCDCQCEEYQIFFYPCWSLSFILQLGFYVSIHAGVGWLVSTNSRYWLSVGAQPSDPVQRILFRAGLLPPPPMVVITRKGGPREMHPVDPLTGRLIDSGN